MVFFGICFHIPSTNPLLRPPAMQSSSSGMLFERNKSEKQNYCCACCVFRFVFVFCFLYVAAAPAAAAAAAAAAVATAAVTAVYAVFFFTIVLT